MPPPRKHYWCVFFILLGLLVSAAHITIDHYDFSNNGIVQFLEQDCNDCTFSHSAAAVDNSTNDFVSEVHQDSVKQPDISLLVSSVSSLYLIRAPPGLN